VHTDQHALAFVQGSSSFLTLGNGGMHGTTNANAASSSAAPTWFNMDTGLNTIEFYSGDISGTFDTAASPPG
jgi:Na+/H+-translocating membrane pyrophosphatase